MTAVLERVLKYHNIVDVIGASVPLQKLGDRLYLGFCPFEEHPTPTFFVSQADQSFVCHACGARGNLIDYVSCVEQISPDQVLAVLGEKANLPLNPESDEFTRRKRMFWAQDLAAKFYHHVLMNTAEGKQARSYLESRGITRETMETFQLGYAPNRWDTIRTFLNKRGYEDELLDEAGLIAKSTTQVGRYFDCFRDRVMFPIHDEYGRVVGFGGRALGDGKPKYMNTEETPIFKKSRNLFNAHRALLPMQTDGNALLLEGYVDVVMAYQHGIHNAVAALGTALTIDQVRFLQNNTREIVLVFDGDEAGQKAATRSCEVLNEADMRGRVATIPNGLDPDEFLREFGPEAFDREVLDCSLALPIYQINAIRVRHDLNDPKSKEAFYREAIEKVLVDVTDDTELEQYMRYLQNI